MAISLRSSGSWAISTSTTQTVTLPTHDTGDMLIVRCGVKPYTAAPVINTSGWAPVADSFADGTVANGSGLGSVRVRAFYKVATSSSETNPVVTWGATAAPGASVALAYQKGGSETWATPVGDAGPDTTADTTVSVTIQSHVAVAAGDMVDFFYVAHDNTTCTVPSISQTGVSFGTVSEQPATALSTTTSNDLAADGGYRLATSGTSSTAAVVAGTMSSSETLSAWMTRLRVSSGSTVDSFTADAFIVVEGVNPLDAASSNAASTTLSYAVSEAEDRVLVVAVQQEGTTLGAPTVQYGGEDMTNVVDLEVNPGSTSQRVTLFWIDDAGIEAAANTNIVVSNSVAASISIHAISFFNASQEVPTNFDSASAADATPIVDCDITTSEDGSAVVAAAGMGNTGTASWANINEQTEQDAVNATAAGSLAAGFYPSSSTAVSTDCTWSNQNRAVTVAMEIEPAGAVTVPGSFSANAVIQKAQSGSFALDALRLDAGAGSTTVDAMLWGQEWRPDGDIYTGSWTVTPLWSKIDDDDDTTITDTAT